MSTPQPTGTCAHCGDPIVRERIAGALEVSRWVHRFTGKELCELDDWQTAEPAIAASHQADARPLTPDTKGGHTGHGRYHGHRHRRRR